MRIPFPMDVAVLEHSNKTIDKGIKRLEKIGCTKVVLIPLSFLDYDEVRSTINTSVEIIFVDVLDVIPFIVADRVNSTSVLTLRYFHNF